MSKFAINQSPLMTDHLIGELQTFRKDPVVILDVGARGGLNAEWAVFADQLKVYCFEPDEDECRRLTAAAPPHVHYIPSALGRSSGAATLYEAKLAASTSLYATRPDYFGRMLNRDNGTTVGQRPIFVKALDEVLREQGIASVDFIKLDTEGAELDILAGGAACIAGQSLLGVLTEIRFHEEINGSPPFAQLDIFLYKFGFRLYDLQFNRQSRIALPYPGLQDYRLPSGERFFAYTTRGQVQDGDALYFRDLLLKTNARLLDATSPINILKLCCFMELYSLNDTAGELVLANRERIAEVANPDKLLDLLASGIAGQAINYHDYIKNYFSSSSAARTESPVHLPARRRDGILGWISARLARDAK